MTVLSSTPQKVLAQKVSPSQFRLICPVCGKLSHKVIDFQEVAAIALRGDTSICPNCDLAADQTAPSGQGGCHYAWH